MDMKTCKTCSTLRSIEEFYLSKGRRDTTCVYCRRKQASERYHDPETYKRIQEYRYNYYRTPEYREKDRQRRIDNPYRVWARKTRSSHVCSGYEVYLSLDELEQIARNHGNCMLCGKPLSYLKHSKVNGDNPTVDRLNNEKYLGKNNIFIVCHKCNTMKGNMTMQDFITYCVMIGNKFGKRD